MKKLFVSVLVVASFLLCATSCKKEQLSLSRDSSISVTVSEAAALNTKSSAQETLVLESLDPEAPGLYMVSSPYTADALMTKSAAVTGATLGGVYPRFTLDAFIDGKDGKYLDKIGVNYTSSDKKWTLAAKADGEPCTWSWDAEKGKYSDIAFWAWACDSDFAPVEGSVNDNISSLSFNYSNYRGGANTPYTKDLLVAYKKQSMGTVDFKFAHALAAVGAFVDPEQEPDAKIIDCSFNNVLSTGACTCAPASGTSVSFAWTGSSPASYAASLDGTDALSQNNFHFIIPQTLGSDATVTITVEKNGVKRIHTYSLAGTKWEAGRKYVYKLGYPSGATLESGREFWNAVSTIAPESGIESVEFKTASPISDYGSLPRIEVQDLASRAKIYAVYDASSKKLIVATNADEMFANASMAGMFIGDMSGIEGWWLTKAPAYGTPFFKLKSIKFGPLNTKNTTDMRYMFAKCEALTSVDFSSLNTENVESFDSMFMGAGFIEIDLSSWKTSSLKSTQYMFSDCPSLTTVTLGGSFTTDKVTQMRQMFYDCKELTTLILGDKFTMSSAKTMQYMFGNCNKLKELNFNGFDTPNASDITGMFQGCQSLSSIDLSKFKTSSATSSAYMFYDCRSLEELKLGADFNVRNVTQMKYMFYNCVKLKSLDIRQFETSKVADMTGVFMQCKGLENLYFDKNKFKTSSATSMDLMFDYCQSLKSLDLSGFDTSKVTTFKRMFSVCATLESLDLSGFVTSSATTMAQMFDACSGLKTLNLSSFNTTGVTDMTRMFTGCKSLENLNVSSFDTANVTTMSEMFFACEGLKKLDLTNFNTSRVVDMTSMLRSCLRLAELKLGTDFKVASTKVSMMADCAANLSSADLICTDAIWSDITSGTDINTTIWHHTTL